MQARAAHTGQPWNQVDLLLCAAALGLAYLNLKPAFFTISPILLVEDEEDCQTRTLNIQLESKMPRARSPTLQPVFNSRGGAKGSGLPVHHCLSLH